MTQSTRIINGNLFVDHLFTFEKAENAFQKFSYTVSTDESKTFLSFLAMFDAVMTGAVDVSRYVSLDIKQIERYVGKLEHSLYQES